MHCTNILLMSVYLPEIHFPPSGLVYPGLQRHQAAWLSTSQNAFDPQDTLPHGEVQVRFRHACVFGHSLSLLHNSFCEGVSSTEPSKK